MSDTEVRDFFETMLADPAPDTTDIEAAISAGERRRRRRVTAAVLSSAAAVVLVAVVLVVVVLAATIPDHTTAPPPISNSASPSPLVLTGSLVTEKSQLLGTWQTIQLGADDISGIRDTNGNSLHVSFAHSDKQWWWWANDLCNDTSGHFQVLSNGDFRAQAEATSLVGCLSPKTFDYSRNVATPAAADQANLIPANDTAPARLLLSKNGVVTGVYERMASTTQSPSPTPSGSASQPPARTVSVGDQIRVPGLKVVITVNDDGFCLDPATGLSAAQSSDLPTHNCWSASDPNSSLGVGNTAVGSSSSWGSHTLHTGLTVPPVEAVTAVQSEHNYSGVVLAPTGKAWRIYYAVTPWTPNTIDASTTGDPAQWAILLYDASGDLIRQ